MSLLTSIAKGNGLVRSLLALLVICTLCAMFLLQRAVPAELLGLAGIILGWYFATSQPAARTGG